MASRRCSRFVPAETRRSTGRALAVVALASATGAIGVMLVRDPEEPLAVAAVIAAFALFAGSSAGLVQVAARGDGRRRRGDDARAFRRASEVAGMIALLLLLRVTDALTVITGSFIVGSFVVAEIILSARPGRASR